MSKIHMFSYELRDAEQERSSMLHGSMGLRKQFLDCPFKACFKQMCFNLKPQEYMDNNLYVNSVFIFIMRQCPAIFSSNLYETSNDQFKTLHKSLQFSNLCMPFTISLVFQDGQISLVEVVLYCVIIF